MDGCLTSMASLLRTWPDADRAMRRGLECAAKKSQRPSGPREPHPLHSCKVGLACQIAEAWRDLSRRRVSLLLTARTTVCKQMQPFEASYGQYRRVRA